MKSIQSKGGDQRAKNLSPERRSEIAAAAANSRWSGVSGKGIVLKCASGKSPSCSKEVTVVAGSERQAQRVILRLNWIILHDHERVYGYMCHECVKAHATNEQT